MNGRRFTSTMPFETLIFQHGKYRKVWPEIIELMDDGWQLGECMIRHKKSLFWLQRELLVIGEYHLCYHQSAQALLRRGLIRDLPRRAEDPTWLIRYERVRAEPDEGSDDPSTPDSER
jgi:hypothetical protein